MIFSDAGYALLLGLLLWAMPGKRMGRTATGRGLRDVMLALVIFSIVYGVLVGSYFGVAPPAGSMACVATRSRRLELTLDDVDFDRRRNGAPRLFQLGHRMVARRHSSTALSALGWSSHSSWGFLVVAGENYRSVRTEPDFPARRRTRVLRSAVF